MSEVLYHEITEAVTRDAEATIAVEREALGEKEKALADANRELKEREKGLQEQIENQVKHLLQEREAEIRKKLEHDTEELHQEQIKTLQNELKEKSDKVKELNKSKAEIERLKREKDELREEIEAEGEKKLTERLKEEREKIHKTEQERVQMTVAERDKVIADLKQQLQDAQRKVEQSSQQLQGEVQELAVEDWLRAEFPLDEIEEIRKGAQGADCIQMVNTRERPNCGSVYYESKRTKSFQASWIEKFKNDIREKNATIGVIVTETMPANMERMGLKDGVWICNFEEFKGLAAVLRDSIIRVSVAMSSVEDRGTKMGMLYTYLTGNEFRLQVEAIVEGFTQMQRDLDSEKRAMQQQWKKREKQIEKVLLNTTNMYGAIRGIAGSSVQPVIGLEFQGGPDQADERGKITASGNDRANVEGREND